MTGLQGETGITSATGPALHPQLHSSKSKHTKVQNVQHWKDSLCFTTDCISAYLGSWAQENIWDPTRSRLSHKYWCSGWCYSREILFMKVLIPYKSQSKFSELQWHLYCCLCGGRVHLLKHCVYFKHGAEILNHFQMIELKGISRCKFNPWSKSPWNYVRLPLERSS